MNYDHEITEIKVEMAHLDESVKQAFKMINEQREELKAIHTISLSVE